MKYACIGERLKHSFSKEIHNALADYEYELCEIPKDELDGFLKKRDFIGINVTLPYKERVIPYLDKIHGAAKEIGAVNTVVNRGGKLYGYNTDFYGMTELFRHAGISAKGKKAAILGSGGTSKTAKAVLSHLGASEILTVSRAKSDICISYEELYLKHADTEIIVNTTPVGMFPETESSPLNIEAFDKLSGVIDVVYNPIRTKLVSDAAERKIPAESGLFMLVAQAVRASELFLGKEYESDVLLKVFEKTKRDKENIVLIGMPSSGKSTLGKVISTLLKRPFFDSDEEIVKHRGEIPKIFKDFGEKTFRDYESEIINELSKKTGAVIATGGGAILREENLKALKRNGKIIFIDRALSDLEATDTRPLSSDKEALKRLYEERLPLYQKACDVSFTVDTTPELLAKRIKEKLFL